MQWRNAPIRRDDGWRNVSAVSVIIFISRRREWVTRHTTTGDWHRPQCDVLSSVQHVCAFALHGLVVSFSFAASFFAFSSFITHFLIHLLIIFSRAPLCTVMIIVGCSCFPHSSPSMACSIHTSVNRLPLALARLLPHVSA